MASFEEFYNSLPEDSNKRGELFEKVFIPWFLTTAPEWSSKINKIWLWDEYPQRWGQDCGIDLVFEDKEKRHWAVQSKCVSPDREISKAEIDSFLSESNDSRIYKRLLVASTNGIGKNAKQVIKRQEKKVICILKEYFDESSVIFPSSLDDLSTGSAPEKRTPRPHQQEAINDVVNGLQHRERGQLLMACGTGKTLTSLWIKEALKAKRVLVLLPSLSLLSQTWKEWSSESQGEMNSLCVCSDKTVVKQDKSVDAWIEDASDHGVDVTSDPDEIRKFISENDSGVVFSTYQSSPLIVDAQSGSEIPSFDIAFADEAHRCAGKVSASFGSVLDDHQIRASKRLFMTATPRVMTSHSRKKAAEKDIDVACMDDTSLFGEVLHQLSFSKAIEQELLTDYRVLIIGVDDPTVHSKIINRELVSIQQEVDTDAESLANHIALSQAMANPDYGLKRIITFHGRVKGAKKFSEIHQDVLDWLPEDSKSSKELKIGHVAGTMNSAQRNQAISRLRNVGDGELGILSNARCLSEGVDVPALNGVAFIEPKRSTVDIIQAVGRAIRKSDAKDYGYILLPVYLGDTTNGDQAIIASRFKGIWDVLLALKSQDDTLCDFLDNLRIEIGKRGECDEGWEGFEKIEFDMPPTVTKNFAKSIRTLLIQQTTNSWNETYGSLCVCLDCSGGSFPAKNGEYLGNWIGTQRTLYKRKELAEYKVTLLEDIPGWSWYVHDDRWLKKYSEYIEYLSLNNGVSPTGSHVLSSWAKHQRKKYRINELDIERIKLLEKIDGWKWDLLQELDEEWRKNLSMLEAYIDNNGVLPKTEQSFLGRWVSVQRNSFKNNSLSQERCQLLEELNGWVWSHNDAAWINYFEELRSFIQQNNNLYPITSTRLGRWVHKQRQKYKNNDLSHRYIAKLQSLDNWMWDPSDNSWESKCDKLAAYLIEHSFQLPPQAHELGPWVNQQRQKYKKNQIREDRRLRLEKLEGWSWSQLEENWNSKFRLLKNYHDSHSCKIPPQSHRELGAWVSSQKQNYKKNNLSSQRISRLNSLSGWRW